MNRIAIGRTNECFWICSCLYKLMWSSVSGAAPGLADKVSTPGNKKAAFQSVAHYPGEYLAFASQADFKAKSLIVYDRLEVLQSKCASSRVNPHMAHVHRDSN